MTAKEQVNALIDCNCGEMYKSRGLCAPDCPQCNYAEDVIELIKHHAVEFADHIVRYNGQVAVLYGKDEKLRDSDIDVVDLYDEFNKP